MFPFARHDNGASAHQAAGAAHGRIAGGGGVVDSFQWIQGALDIIVGLGMTRIAVAVVHLGSARRTLRLHWVPFARAFCIFVLLLQFSWNFVGLDRATITWSFGLFLALLRFVMTLFAAAALMLPDSAARAGAGLMDWHRDNGRWAMVFLTGCVLMAYPFNACFSDDSPLENSASPLFAMAAMTAFFALSSRVLGVATGLALLLALAILQERIDQG
jgi:hypothetical protein